MKTPDIVSPQEWEAARASLLVKEKALTRARDALAAERRRMPWQAVEKEYRFTGPAGEVTLADLFGFTQVTTVEAWIPLFLFSVLFGLSMDYHVFLLSRIRERYLETGDTEDAITFGISSSARLITGAALIMVAVFSGFAAGELVMFQQMGFGLAVAVLVDATLVRTILVPATMKLLGRWNFYLPSRLAWLPRFDVEAPATAHTSVTA